MTDLRELAIGYYTHCSLLIDYLIKKYKVTELLIGSHTVPFDKSINSMHITTIKRSGIIIPDRYGMCIIGDSYGVIRVVVDIDSKTITVHNGVYVYTESPTICTRKDNKLTNVVMTITQLEKNKYIIVNSNYTYTVHLPDEYYY